MSRPILTSDHAPAECRRVRSQKRSLRSGCLAILAAVACARSARADIVPGTVSTDPFDSTQGTVVVANDVIVDAVNAFRTAGGFEGGQTLMRNGGVAR